MNEVWICNHVRGNLKWRAQVILLEKRVAYMRHNVVKLWPSTVHALKAIGIKFFFPAFCCGGMEHIGIRRLQSSLLKVALLLGVDFRPGTVPHILFTISLWYSASCSLDHFASPILLNCLFIRCGFSIVLLVLRH